MSATASCPHCGVAMDVPESLRGGEVECPSCEKPFHPEIDDSQPISPRLESSDEYREYFDRTLLRMRIESAEARLRPAATALVIIAFIRLMIASARMLAIRNFLGILPLGFGAPSDGMVILEFGRTFISVFGAWKMLNARSFGWGLTGAIMMLIPANDSFCTCITGFIYMGIGIWALVIINDPDVRWLIRQKQGQEMDTSDD